MTARLGSEYRYFGKLVLVPFRYFSIDIYRNIDIFDNTNVLCWSHCFPIMYAGGRHIARWMIHSYSPEGLSSICGVGGDSEVPVKSVRL